MARITNDSIQQLKLHEVMAGSIDVELLPTTPIINLETSNNELENEDYEIYETYDQILQENDGTTKIRDKDKTKDILSKRKKGVIPTTRRSSDVNKEDYNGITTTTTTDKLWKVTTQSNNDETIFEI